MNIVVIRCDCIYRFENRKKHQDGRICFANYQFDVDSFL